MEGATDDNDGFVDLGDSIMAARRGTRLRAQRMELGGVGAASGAPAAVADAAATTTSLAMALLLPPPLPLLPPVLVLVLVVLVVMGAASMTALAWNVGSVLSWGASGSDGQCCGSD